MKLNPETLRRAVDPPPASFIQAMDQTLDCIERGATQQPSAWTRRRVVTIVLAAVLALASLAAVAEGFRRGLFDFLRTQYGEESVTDAVSSLVRTDLASLTRGRTTLTVQEALYDGRTLRVVYRLHWTGMDEMVTEQDLGDPGSAFYAGLRADGVLALEGPDFFIIDGQEISMPGGSSARTVPGEVAGEALHYLDIRLGGSGVHPQGPFTVGLPVLAEDTRTRQALTFTLDGAVPVQRLEASPAPNGSVTITFTDAWASPLRIYLDYRVDIAADVPEAQAFEQMLAWSDAHLVDSQGQLVGGPGKWEGVTYPEADDIRHRVLTVEYPPADTLPSPLYFAPVIYGDGGEATADMTQAVPVTVQQGGET